MLGRREAWIQEFEGGDGESVSEKEAPECVEESKCAAGYDTSARSLGHLLRGLGASKYIQVAKGLWFELLKEAVPVGDPVLAGIETPSPKHRKADAGKADDCNCADLIPWGLGLEGRDSRREEAKERSGGNKEEARSLPIHGVFVLKIRHQDAVSLERGAFGRGCAGCGLLFSRHVVSPLFGGRRAGVGGLTSEMSRAPQRPDRISGQARRLHFAVSRPFVRIRRCFS